LLGNLERKPEKFDGSIYVSRLLQINTDPATLGKDVVGFGAASRDQVIADFHRKRDVHQTVAMYVTDFPSSKTIFCTSKAMRSRCDPGQSCKAAWIFSFALEMAIRPSPNHLI
jgi:hypothetical protein